MVSRSEKNSFVSTILPVPVRVIGFSDQRSKKKGRKQKIGLFFLLVGRMVMMMKKERRRGMRRKRRTGSGTTGKPGRRGGTRRSRRRRRRKQAQNTSVRTFFECKLYRARNFSSSYVRSNLVRSIS
jgi:hypothetical protein